MTPRIRPTFRPTLLELETRAVPSSVPVSADPVPAGQAPDVVVRDAAGAVVATIAAYEPGMTGGVRVAVADLTGDGVMDIVTAPGVGGGPRVRVFDGTTFAAVADYFAYDEAFRGGVSVDAGSIGMGAVGVVTGPGVGGAPHVRVFTPTGAVVTEFFAYHQVDRGGATVDLSTGPDGSAVLTARGIDWRRDFDPWTGEWTRDEPVVVDDTEKPVADEDNVIDLDGDGVPDGTLVDADGDGEPDTIDVDGDGEPDGVAVDLDGDGVSDGVGYDLDGDGDIDAIGLDTDGDGLPDPVDVDGDGVADGIAVDLDGDGVADGVGYDFDGDGRIDAIGLDTDGDGVPDGVDLDGDGQIDGQGVDSDGDGLIDGVDLDGDGSIDATAGWQLDPQAMDDLFEGIGGWSIEMDVLLNDLDFLGGGLDLLSVGDPGHGTLVVNPDGTITYTPDGGYVGTDTFGYTSGNEFGYTGSGVAVIDILGSDGNHPPLAVNDTVSVTAGQSVSGFVLTNDSDPDGDPLSVTSSGQPAHGSVTVSSSGYFTYTPSSPPSYTGLDSYTYTIGDGRGGSDTATVFVRIAMAPPKVHVIWIEGTTAVGAAGGLAGKGPFETQVMDPLKQELQGKNVEYYRYRIAAVTTPFFLTNDLIMPFLGVGGARTVLGKIDSLSAKEENKGDKFVLAGYSYGAYTALLTLKQAYINKVQGGPALVPKTHIDFVYTDDPITGIPGTPAYTASLATPYSNAMDANMQPTLLGKFGKGYNWYQQLDTGGSIVVYPGNIRGRAVTKFTNVQYQAADFPAYGPPGAHHSGMVGEPLIAAAIKDRMKADITTLLGG